MKILKHSLTLMANWISFGVLSAVSIATQAADIDIGEKGHDQKNYFAIFGASFPRIETKRRSADIVSEIDIPGLGPRELPLPSSGLKVDSYSVMPTILMGYYPMGQGYISINGSLGAPVFSQSVYGNGFLSLAGEIASLKVLPIVALVSVHPFPHATVSPYFGIGGAWVWTYDEKIQNKFYLGEDAKIKTSDPFGLVLAIGTDINISERFFFNMDFKYISGTKFDNSIDNSQLLGLIHQDSFVEGLELDTYAVNLGMGIRF